MRINLEVLGATLASSLYTFVLVVACMVSATDCGKVSSAEAREGDLPINGGAG
jgi:hypothetical protein